MLWGLVTSDVLIMDSAFRQITDVMEIMIASMVQMK